MFRSSSKGALHQIISVEVVGSNVQIEFEGGTPSDNLTELAQRMKSVPGQLLWEIWEIMKQNNSFLVKQNNKNSTKVQFSEDTNHLYHFTHLSFQVNHITMFFLIALWQANHITLFFFQPENKTRCSHTMGN